MLLTLKSVGEMQSLQSPEMMLTMKKGVQQRRKTPMMIPMVMAALCSRYSGVLVDDDEDAASEAACLPPTPLPSSLCLLRRSLRACILANIELSVRVPTSPFAAADATGAVSLEASSILDKRPSPLRALADTLTEPVFDWLKRF